MRGQIRIQMKMRMAMGRRVSWFNITEEDQNQNQCEDEVFTLRCCRGKRKYRELEVTKISVAKAGMPSDEESMLMMLPDEADADDDDHLCGSTSPPNIGCKHICHFCHVKVLGRVVRVVPAPQHFHNFLMLIDYDTRIGIR